MSPIIKKYIKELKHSSRCCLCGEGDDCCLEFHHVNKESKCFSIGKIPHNASLDDVKRELAKTICVCANCHRKIHNGMIDACCYNSKN